MFIVRQIRCTRRKLTDIMTYSQEFKAYLKDLGFFFETSIDGSAAYSNRDCRWNMWCEQENKVWHGLSLQPQANWRGSRKRRFLSAHQYSHKWVLPRCGGMDYVNKRLRAKCWKVFSCFHTTLEMSLCPQCDFKKYFGSLPSLPGTSPTETLMCDAESSTCSHLCCNSRAGWEMKVS